MVHDVIFLTINLFSMGASITMLADDKRRWYAWLFLTLSSLMAVYYVYRIAGLS